MAIITHKIKKAIQLFLVAIIGLSLWQLSKANFKPVENGVQKTQTIRSETRTNQLMATWESSDFQNKIRFSNQFNPD